MLLGHMPEEDCSVLFFLRLTSFSVYGVHDAEHSFHEAMTNVLL